MSDLPNALYIGDMSDGKVTQLARTAYPSGNIQWVGGSGDFVGWTDMDREFSDDSAAAVWQLKVMNLQDHTTWTVASSGGRAANGAPLFAMSGTSLAWLAPNADGETSSIRVADLVGRSVRTVAAGVQSSILGISGGYITYDAPDGGAASVAVATDSQSPRDIFVIPATGGTPHQLSTQHDVTFPSAAAGWVVWGTPANGDAEQVWAAPIDASSAPQQVYSGGNVQRAVGHNFVALWTNGATNLVVIPLNAQGLPGQHISVAGTAYMPAHFSTDGSLLAYAEDTDPTATNDVITVRVARVDVRGSN